jgi:hypothetical protein
MYRFRFRFPKGGQGKMEELRQSLFLLMTLWNARQGAGPSANFNLG